MRRYGPRLHGNLTSDGRFTCTWDAENRLVSMETHSNVPFAARRKLAFSYDSMGRRIRKSVWHGVTGGGWQLRHHFDFIHELNGWNILAERSGGSANGFIRTYAWGTDLSGTLSGAGGVGGLLFATLHTSGKTFAYGADLNGNVTLLVDTATGQAAATYDYGPFGELLRQSGEYAALNPYRFSTKYTDDETGWLDYGRRYYDPKTGRWPSRDPIEESGGVNLYRFVANDGVNQGDMLGMDFIAVGSSYAIHAPVGGGWEIAVRGAGHLMLTYWKDSKLCLRVGDKKDGNASNNPTAWTRWGMGPHRGGGWKSVANDTTGTDEVIQLGFTSDWELKYTRTLWPFTWTEVDNPDISQINIFPTDSDADQYKIIYADTPTTRDASTKWAAIQAAAASYAYAEHRPFVSGGAAKNWPNSHYGHLVADGNYNNSNTFAHVMAASIGATIPLGGWGGRSHPGNISPVPVSDTRPDPKYK